jgi:hypothetical protein
MRDNDMEDSQTSIDQEFFCRLYQRYWWMCGLFFLSFLFIVGGCKTSKPPYDPDRTEDIQRIVVYDVDPSRNPDVYTKSLEELATFTHANFDQDLFCKYLKTATYSRHGGLHRGGNLVVIVHKDGSEIRMSLAYSGSLRSKDKGIYTSTNKSMDDEFKREHRRIVVDVFIPARKKRI